MNYLLLFKIVGNAGKKREIKLFLLLFHLFKNLISKWIKFFWPRSKICELFAINFISSYHSFYFLRYKFSKARYIKKQLINTKQNESTFKDIMKTLEFYFFCWLRPEWEYIYIWGCGTVGPNLLWIWY